MLVAGYVLYAKSALWRALIEALPLWRLGNGKRNDIAGLALHCV